MNEKECNCSEKDNELTCRSCSSATPPYWCETCQRLVPEKRCPECGLKCRKVYQPGLK